MPELVSPDEPTVSASVDTLLQLVARAPAVPAGTLLAPGDEIGGDFVIEGRLGAGGMAEVYLARDRRLDRRVAIKIHRGAQDAAAAARMQREARAVARLSHPHVVTVHETARSGRLVALVMEYLDGGSARDAAADPDRGTGELLALYLQAGEGLAAAHAAGLVHRDVKPDNILVGGDGRARIADFGLAHLDGDGALDGATPSGSPAVGSGSIAGTPAYMAPEQLDGRADARSDQFSFCVALYEALWAHRPFAGATARELASACRAGAFDERPPARPVSPHLRSVLRRGLAADPEARFPSMAALLAALRRDPRARRRRIAVAAAALTLAAALGAGAYAATRPVHGVCAAADEDDRAVWSVASSVPVRVALARAGGAAIADTVVAGLTAYTEALADARHQACEATHRAGSQSADLLDRRNLCLDDRRAALEVTIATLSGPDPSLVERAPELVAALPDLAVCADRALLLSQAPPPADPAAQARVTALRRALRAARALAARDPAAAGAAVETVRRDADGLSYPPLAADILALQAFVDLAAHEHQAAAAGYQKAYYAARTAGHDERAVEVALQLVFVHGARLGDVERAQDWLELARADVERRFAGTALEAELHEYVGMLAGARGAFADAVVAHERALALREAVDAPPIQVARSLVHIGNSLSSLGRAEASLPLLERAAALVAEGTAPMHPHVYHPRAALGHAQWELGRYREALGNYRTALAVARANGGDANPLTAEALQNIAIAEARLGRTAAARRSLERALAVLETIHGPDHPDVGHALANLASIALEQDDLPGARDLAGRAAAISERAHGPVHPDVALALANLGAVLVADDAFEDARPVLERARAIFEQTMPEHPRVAGTLASLGAVYRAAGDTVRASALLRQAVADFERAGNAAGAASARAQLAKVAGVPAAPSD